MSIYSTPVFLPASNGIFLTQAGCEMIIFVVLIVLACVSVTQILMRLTAQLFRFVSKKIKERKK